MQITKEDVLHVAKLGKLYLKDEKVDKFRKNLSDIVQYAKRLDEVDVSGISPTAAILPLQNVFRKDEAAKSMDREKILQNAPEKSYGCFWVRNKVVE
ncbi:MAG: asparaginyl/glutamyl-tRNA amidotransferase subunit C [Clostridiales bacterium GWE2_32_10]|nr:MAG: asparaginyl/glutamyl-tRNA amidotransferase subunit C [Clostridiales bacterium GWE2_32_10]HBY21589.1 Asp-tRNA(Asn)/Glu-tRNA(Gln) amidotransferase subunit GatB [Clostridiales bacterium]